MEFTENLQQGLLEKSQRKTKQKKNGWIPTMISKEITPKKLLDIFQEELLQEYPWENLWKYHMINFWRKPSAGILGKFLSILEELVLDFF